MTRQFVGGLLVSWIAIVGCNASSPGGLGIAATPNSSGVANTTISTSKPMLGEVEKSFRLSGPALSTHVEQGATASAQMTIARGKNFQDDVRLKFAALPAGVTVETTNPLISHSDGDTTVEFRATPEALPGTYTVTVIGEPTSGPDAKSDFQITVDKR
ncbi:MAG: hypothetical protein JWP89_1067 [Schlesneria sp.]|nr:hypothetical protein [Schlesneria sp.]